MDNQTDDLIYRSNAIFELYKCCLENNISGRTFSLLKNAINKARRIQPDKEMEGDD